MAPKQYTEKVALRRRLAVQKEDQARQRIARLIHLFTEMLDANDLMGEPPSEEWKEVLRPALFARRAVLPICQPLNPQAVLSLNKLYAREHELLKTAQDATLSRVFAEEEDEDLSRPLARKIGSNAKWEGDVTKAGHLALFRVAQDRLRDKVDRATFQSGQTQLLSTSQTPHRFPVFAEALLADFFSVCSTPDTAELWMLAEACEAPDVNDIQYWFEARTRRLREA